MTYLTTKFDTRWPKTVNSLLAVTGLLFLILISSLGNLIWIGLKRERAVHDLATLKDRVTALEAEYFRATATIDLDYAHQIGFEDGGDKVIFAARNNTPQVLSWRAPDNDL